MSGLKKFVIVLAILVIVFPAVAFGYVYSRLKTMQDPNQNFESLLSNDYKSDDDIVNILLMGTDERPGETVSRSDSMMILTIDNKHKSLKLTSLGRDTYVYIKGHGKQKLTHAYAYGKANLLIDTIERNFNLDIQHYAQVNFFSFMDIVDALGGVEVNIDESEIHELNKFINETYSWDKNPKKGAIKYVEKPGKQLLNGYQALSFSRIRKNDGTMERDSRQRQVIQSMLSKMNTLSLSKYNKLMESILPYVKTNMSPTEMLTLAKDILSIGNLKLNSIQFPFHPEYETKEPDKGYVIPFGKFEVEILHDFIFENKTPTKEEIDRRTKEYFRNGGVLNTDIMRTFNFDGNSDRNNDDDDDDDNDNSNINSNSRNSHYSDDDYNDSYSSDDDFSSSDDLNDSDLNSHSSGSSHHFSDSDDDEFGSVQDID